MTETVLAWHFFGAALRDGLPLPPDGEWLVLPPDVPVKLCESGFHGSRRIIDALTYAPGANVARVEIHGDVAEDEVKLAGRERRILWRIDATDTLRAFARACALDVIHLWDAPAVVREYLTTGDKKLRDAARDAAWSAAGSAAGDAAGASAGAVAWSAAWSAARAAEVAAAGTAQNERLESMIRTAAGKVGAP